MMLNLSIAKNRLCYPLVAGMDIDDPRTISVRRRIIQEKGFLRKIYEEWYSSLTMEIPDGQGGILEIGSGAGFLRKFVPGLVTSEFIASEVDCILDAQQMPVSDHSLRGILMTNVLHHIPRPALFLSEASRCVRPGGVLAMIEPWVSPWSRLVYRKLHHEHFEPEAKEWEFKSLGPVSSANGALPWIIFERDRERFERNFPMWEIRIIKPMMPFVYLLSGGVSIRFSMPSLSYRIIRAVEDLVRPWRDSLAMFAKIVLLRRKEVE